ncbi:putative membrane protein [Clostridium botulinum]|nr:putative membrane protein [Clostridium botulinum]
MKKISDDFKLFITTAAAVGTIMFLAKVIYFQFIYRNL